MRYVSGAGRIHLAEPPNPGPLQSVLPAEILSSLPASPANVEMTQRQILRTFL